MIFDRVTNDLIASTLTIAAFYLFVYLIVLMYHRQLHEGHIVGVETLVFFLALDMALATGRVELSCFIPELPIRQKHDVCSFVDRYTVCNPCL